MDIVADAYNLIGSIICHQLPSRTLTASGTPLPLCARDTGIYLGVFIALVYIALRGRLNSDMPPKVSHTLILCAFMLPMAFDGLSSYIGLRGTDNTIRLLTGAFFGMPIPFFLVPAAKFKADGENHRGVLKKGIEIIYLSAIVLLACIVLLKTGLIPWLLISTIILFSFLFILGRVAYTIAVRSGLMKYKFGFLFIPGTVVFVLYLMFLISNFILQPLKNVLLYR